MMGSIMTWPHYISCLLLCLVTHWFMGIWLDTDSVLLLATLQYIYMQSNCNFWSCSWINDGFEVLSWCDLVILTIICVHRQGGGVFCSLFESLYHGHHFILFHHHYLVCLRCTLISLWRSSQNDLYYGKIVVINFWIQMVSFWWTKSTLM